MPFPTPSPILTATRGCQTSGLYVTVWGSSIHTPRYDLSVIVIIVQALYMLLGPLLAARLSKMASWLNTVLVCYILGLLAGNFSPVSLDDELSTAFTEGAIPLAIPLLLFSTDFRAWLKYGGTAVGSFVLACICACTASFSVAQLFASQTEEFWKIAGMLVGVYTGGTPNMLSIGLALEVQEKTFILMNAADVITGGTYLLILMTVGKPLLSKILKPFDAQAPRLDEAIEETPIQQSTQARVKSGALALLLAIGILGVSAGGSLLIFDKMPVAPVIFALTTLGIIASLFPKVRALKVSADLGNYFILVFCVAIGLLTDLSQLMGGSAMILSFCAAVMALAIVLHLITAALFKIDVDTFIITSTASVFGPAFVPPIAKRIGNEKVLLSGLTTGLVGYAVGNYLGLALAYFMKP